MRKSMDIDFERCTSGIEFEEWVKELLGQLRMKAERVVKNDCGIDIIAIAAVNKNTTKRFYIQCKYYNKPLGKGPIQEILFIWLWQHKGLPLADKELLLKRTIADSYDYAENYDKIKVRPMDINTKGEFPLVV